MKFSFFHRFARLPFTAQCSQKRTTFRPQVERLGERVLPCTITWTNPNAGFWDLASNWDRGEVPGPDDHACIPPANNAVTFQGMPALLPQARIVESEREFIIATGTFGVTDRFTLLNRVTLVDQFLTIRQGGALTSTLVDQGMIRGMERLGGALNDVTVGSGASISLNNVREESLRVTGKHLTLNGTATLGLNRGFGDYYGGLLFDGDQMLAGDGRVTFASVDTEEGFYSAVVPREGVLTIGPGITISGHRGWVGPGNRWDGSGTFILEGTIHANGNGVITVGAPNWRTTGRLRSDAANSAIHLTDTLNNENGTLRLEGGSGIRLVNGTIYRGAVTTAEGAALGGAGRAADGTAAAILDGVTVEGNLALRHVGEEAFMIRNGLTLNGTATLGLNRGFGDYYGGLLFDGDQMLAGDGRVTFASVDAPAGFYSAVVPREGVLTIGPGITISGLRGWIGTGTPRWHGNGTFILQGAIQSTAGSQITVDANNWVNDGLIASAGGQLTVTGVNWTNNGTIRATNGATLIVTGTSTNYGGNILTGGSWEAMGGILRLTDWTITNNQANILLDGGNARINNSPNGSALALLSTTGGTFTVCGQFFQVPGDLTNSGAIVVCQYSQLTVTGNYSQSNVTPAASLTVGLGGVLQSAFFNQVGGDTYLNAGTIIAPQMRLLVDATLHGSGELRGNVENRGRIYVGYEGAVGGIVVTGNFTQTADGRLYLELGDADYFEHDLLFVTGTAVVRGTVVIGRLPSFVARDGDLFAPLGAGEGLTFTPDTLVIFDMEDEGYRFETWDDGYYFNLCTRRR